VAATGCRFYGFDGSVTVTSYMVASRKPIDWKEFDTFLRFVGCEFKRAKGDHRIYTRKGLRRPIVVPRHKPLPWFVVRNNLRVLELSLDDFDTIRAQM